MSQQQYRHTIEATPPPATPTAAVRRIGDIGYCAKVLKPYAVEDCHCRHDVTTLPHTPLLRHIVRYDTLRR